MPERDIFLALNFQIKNVKTSPSLTVKFLLQSPESVRKNENLSKKCKTDLDQQVPSKAELGQYSKHDTKYHNCDHIKYTIPSHIWFILYLK